MELYQKLIQETTEAEVDIFKGSAKIWTFSIFGSPRTLASFNFFVLIGLNPKKLPLLFSWKTSLGKLLLKPKGDKLKATKVQIRLKRPFVHRTKTARTGYKKSTQKFCGLPVINKKYTLDRPAGDASSLFSTTFLLSSIGVKNKVLPFSLRATPGLPRCRGEKWSWPWSLGQKKRG